MIQRRKLAVGLLVVGLLVALGVAGAQTPKPKRTLQPASVDADKGTYDWQKHQWTFTGNCVVRIEGPDKATMEAPSMTGKTGSNANEISEIIASGPVSFTVVTRKDDQGNQRLIKAGCKGNGVYSGAQRVVTLTGGAEAVMTMIPQDPEAQPTKFTGNSLTINLEDNTVGGDHVHIEMQVPAESVGPAKPGG